MVLSYRNRIISKKKGGEILPPLPRAVCVNGGQTNGNTLIGVELYVNPPRNTYLLNTPRINVRLRCVQGGVVTDRPLFISPCGGGVEQSLFWATSLRGAKSPVRK